MVTPSAVGRSEWERVVLPDLGEHADKCIGVADAVPSLCLKILPNEEDERYASFQ